MGDGGRGLRYFLIIGGFGVFVLSLFFGVLGVLWGIFGGRYGDVVDVL